MNKYDDTDYLIEREESIEYEEGSDINVGSIEKDIKRCEELIKPEHANWIGISNQLAIAHVVDILKEVEEKYLHEKMSKEEVEELLEESIPKQKVKDKIKQIENNIKSADEFMRRNNIVEDEDFHMDTLFKQCEIRILEELLEDK